MKRLAEVSDAVDRVVARCDAITNNDPIKRWVLGDTRDKSGDMKKLVSKSKTNAPSLTRAHSKDPEYSVGQVIDLPPKSFSSNDPYQKGGGDSEWRPLVHKSLIHVPNPRRGFDIPHRDYGIDVAGENETVLAGKYKVHHKDMVDEPHTNGQRKVPRYHLTEIDE